MYTLVLEYPLRKFITTKVVANNEYEEDQLQKGEAYLTKVMQVVPEYIASGRITDSRFTADRSQIVVMAEMEVPASSEEEARSYLDRYLAEIPDKLYILDVKRNC